jgi:hypothetical protein
LKRLNEGHARLVELFKEQGKENEKLNEKWYMLNHDYELERLKFQSETRRTSDLIRENTRLKELVDGVKEELTKKYPHAGQDCECMAHDSCECGCSADWRDPKERQRDGAYRKIAEYKEGK